MDEQEKELTPEAPAQTAEDAGVLSAPEPEAHETTGESYSDADRAAQEESSAETTAPAAEPELVPETIAGPVSEAAPEAEAEVEAEAEAESDAEPVESFTADQILMGMEQPAQIDETQESELLAILEAIVYIT